MRKAVRASVDSRADNHIKGDEHVRDKKFRFWVKSNFSVTGVGDMPFLIHDGKTVALKENLYSIITSTHDRGLSHGGRDQTSWLVSIFRVLFLTVNTLRIRSMRPTPGYLMT